MYHTILVPLDGSTFSERALPMAGALVRLMGARLVLVRAAHASVLPGLDATDAQCRAVDEATAYLQGVVDLLASQGLEARMSVPYDNAAQAILLEIELQQADLVVMCTHGRSGLGRWIYGSVAESILARSPAPVMLVRPTGAPVKLTAGPGQPLLIVPLDGSDFAEAALPHAMALAAALGGRLELLHAVAPRVLAFPEALPVSQGMYRPPHAIVEDECARLAQYLAEVAGQPEAEGLSVQTVVREGEPSDVILHEAQITGARLVVMATHGRTGIGRFLMGSVAHEIVQRTLLPVLLVRPAELPRAADNA